MSLFGLHLSDFGVIWVSGSPWSDGSQTLPSECLWNVISRALSGPEKACFLPRQLFICINNCSVLERQQFCFLYNLVTLSIPHAVQSVAGAMVALSLGTTGRWACPWGSQRRSAHSAPSQVRPSPGAWMQLAPSTACSACPSIRSSFHLRRFGKGIWASSALWASLCPGLLEAKQRTVSVSFRGPNYHPEWQFFVALMGLVIVMSSGYVATKIY